MIRVVVANYNGKKHLRACLEAVLGQTVPDLEVVVVDDASTDESVKLVEKYQPVKLIKLKENGGAARARNRGAKGYQGKYLLFIDVDTKVAKGGIQKAIEEMEAEEKLGAGQLDLADHHGHFLTWFGMPYQARKGEREIFGGITAALVVRRKVFENIGGFDEDYQIYGEDTDLCWRVWLAGYKVRRLEAKATHQGKSSLSKERVYLNGARNSLTSIVKNADGVWVVPMVLLNGLFWLGLAGYKMMTTKTKEAKWIVTGWTKGLENLTQSLEKRKGVVRTNNNEARRVMFGSRGGVEIIQKGWGWINEN